MTVINPLKSVRESEERAKKIILEARNKAQNEQQTILKEKDKELEKKFFQADKKADESLGDIKVRVDKLLNDTRLQAEKKGEEIKKSAKEYQKKAIQFIVEKLKM